MRFNICKIGVAPFESEIPKEFQIKINLVGLIYAGGKFILTHASMEQAVVFRQIMNVVAIPPSINEFAINGCTYKGSNFAGCSFCYIAWYEGHPENPFFMQRDFVETSHFEMQPDSLGIFDVTGKEIIFKGTCTPEVTQTKIIQEVL